MLYRTMTQIGPACDLSGVAKYVERSSFTSFETMVIHYGIAGGLIAGQEIDGAVKLLITGIRNPDAQLLMYRVLEYMAVQMMSYPKWAESRRGMIQSIFIRTLNATPNKEFVKQLILDNCPGVVKTFLGESIAKQTFTAHATTKSVDIHDSSGSTEQLTKLLDAFKRRRIE
jgi:hypothetical protein